MRVALVVERFDPSGGGVEYAACQVARGLAEAGEEVHVIARRASPTRSVQIHRVRSPTFWQPLRVARFSRASGRLVGRHRFDVVQSFSRTLHQDVYHAGGGCHADYLERTHGRRTAQLRRFSPRHAVQLAIEGRVFANPRQLIHSVSHAVAAQITRRFGVSKERIAVIPYGVDAQRFHPDRHRQGGEALRAELGARDVPVWVLVGSGWRRKGLDTALAALATTEDRSAQLWIAGKDPVRPWKQRAEQLGVAGRVRFLGPRGDPERLYAAADGLLLPTRYDAFAMVCLEAAASGIPVVTSRCAGAAELVAEAGVVIARSDDVPGFARALDDLADPALRARLGAQGRKIAEAHSWSDHVGQLRSLYKRVRR